MKIELFTPPSGVLIQNSLYSFILYLNLLRINPKPDLTTLCSIIHIYIPPYICMFLVLLVKVGKTKYLAFFRMNSKESVCLQMWNICTGFIR